MTDDRDNITFWPHPKDIDIDELMKMEGVIEVEQFDQSGHLLKFRSSIMTPSQANLMAMMCGSTFSFISSLFDLTSRMMPCSIHPLRELRFTGLDYSIMLVCEAYACIGVMFKNDKTDYDSLMPRIKKLMG